jgi:hypothetical protein
VDANLDINADAVEVKQSIRFLTLLMRLLYVMDGGGHNDHQDTGGLMSNNDLPCNKCKGQHHPADDCQTRERKRIIEKPVVTDRYGDMGIKPDTIQIDRNVAEEWMVSALICKCEEDRLMIENIRKALGR